MQIVQSPIVSSTYLGMPNARTKDTSQHETFSIPQVTTSQPADEPNMPVKPKRPMTASQAYEQMTMRKIPETERSSKTVEGVTWNDDVLAALAGVGAGVTIDTTKPINWNSTGDQTLSEEQAQALREKYDINNLSPQDHYDLMSELTNMNVLDAKDVMSMHFRKMEPGTFNVIRPSSSSPFGRARNFSSGNLMETIAEELEYLQWYKDDMLLDDYFKRNESVTEQAHSDYLDYIDDRTATMNKLKNVFNQLGRSEKVS